MAMNFNLVSKGFAAVFGTRNDRLIKAYSKRVDEVNALEPEYRRKSDAELRENTEKFREQVRGGTRVPEILPHVMANAREAMDRAVGIRNILDPELGFDVNRLPVELQSTYKRLAQEAADREPEPVKGGEPVPGRLLVDMPVELYEAVRAVYPESRPPFRARPFDVQIIGGMVLGEGRIAEMKTGEGKTIVAPLACYVAAIEDMQSHIVTVNDYLVQRDRDWVFPVYHALGLTVGAIHPHHQQPPELKAQAYTCDAVYGTNAEFGFDYLRDNMKLSTGEQVQKRRDFCIIDEVDSILIDEARTPLIISGPAHSDAPRYDLADQIAAHLVQQQKQWDAADRKVQQAEMKLKGLEGDIRNARDKSKVPQLKEEQKRLEEELPRLQAERDQYTQYYEVEREKKAAHLTHDGVAEAQKKAGIGSFYVGNNMDFPHLLENALRAHVIYTRDKEYVVQNGEVVIVDENTGRLMVGRQWSDGLHQAVEAKERVKIKEETQTLATVTIQNFAKLYKRLAGMTGTAITEATEFNEIYKLDVVCIPTNKPVIRTDRNDLIFLSQRDKWDAILEEIKRVHDIGRPVLVGTTSVETSEMLSELLRKKHGIKHDVLNAKQHEREANIVDDAGDLGAVMIATNMAGRGTDIKLQPIDRAGLIKHWQQRDLISRQADPSMSDEELVKMVYRHIAPRELGMKVKEVEPLSDDQVRMKLLQQWAIDAAWIDEKKVGNMTEEQLLNTLDKVPEFRMHRLKMYENVEQMGGLHIVGTERHESRRIDNQLRGRAGRQGDNGSSRFFISLEDDLMKLFAGKTTMNALSKLGMKEGDAIEHKWLTNSVERAQRKVEERNYEIRKNLLEYDEVMEHQRSSFYATRQDVVEGNHVDRIIFDYIEAAVTDAVELYLDADYVSSQVAEWCRQTLDVSVEPGRLHLDDINDLQAQIRKAAQTEVASVIEVTVGEYMSDDLPPEEWDLDGLRQWAASRFSVDLKKAEMRRLSPEDLRLQLIDEAKQQIQRKDLSGLDKFLVEHYGERQLCDWVQEKFNVEMKPENLASMDGAAAIDAILGKAREAYRQREVAYPVDFTLEMCFGAAQDNAQWAAEQLVSWANNRYELGWDIESIANKPAGELREVLLEKQEPWVHGDAPEKAVRAAVAQHGSGEGLGQWARERFGVETTPDEINEMGDEDAKVAELSKRIREQYRQELTQLERYVVLQILDNAWKEHLYGMDQLKDSVNLRGYAEKDPRIEYKREGSAAFTRMQQTVRNRVTELIFRAKLTPNVRARSAYGDQQAQQHPEAGSTVKRAAQAAAQAQAQGTAEQQADLAAAERAGGGGEADPTDNPNLSRKQRRAAAAKQKKEKGGTKTRARKSR